MLLSHHLETEVDPLESALNHYNCALEDSLLSELTRRVADLEKRVQVLATYDATSDAP